MVTSVEVTHGYLIWAALTDRWELKPEERAEAAVEMRQAATEWLPVKDGSTSRETYLDRWMYEICGYERDVPKGWTLVVEQRADGTYRADAADRQGRSVTATEPDLDAVRSAVRQRSFALENGG
jgi:hypothetical protein